MVDPMRRDSVVEIAIDCSLFRLNARLGWCSVRAA